MLKEPIKRFIQQRNHNNVNPTLLVNQEHDAYIAIRRRKIVIFSAVEPLQIGLFLDFETKEFPIYVNFVVIQRRVRTTS